MTDMTNYKHSHETIKGYKTSKLAQSETNDCVVRTLATVFNLTYNQSHKFCEKELKRLPRKGVRTYFYHDFLSKGSAFGKTITEVKYEPVEIKKTTNTYWGPYTRTETITLYTKRGSKYSRMTVGSFVKQYPKGTFIISVKGHTFAIVDGFICGNYGDFKHKKVRVERVWEIN